MVCLGFIGCEHVHRSAMDYFLAVLVIVIIVLAVRLLICAVARCLNGARPRPSPASTDVEEDVEMWGGTGLAIYRHAHAQQGQPERQPGDVAPLRNEGWQSKLVIAAGVDHVCHIAHPGALHIG